MVNNVFDDYHSIFTLLHFLVALPFLINKRKERHPHNNGMKFHVQVRDIGSDQDNGIAMLSFANLLDLLPYQLKD